MTGKPHAIDGWTARPGDEPRCKPRRPRGCALRGDAFTCGRCHVGQWVRFRGPRLRVCLCNAHL